MLWLKEENDNTTEELEKEWEFRVRYVNEYYEFDNMWILCSTAEPKNALRISKPACWKK